MLPTKRFRASGRFQWYGAAVAGAVSVAALLAALAGAAGYPAATTDAVRAAAAAQKAEAAEVSAPGAAVPQPPRAVCRIAVERSRVVSSCYNPYPEADRVQLHTECDRWWDIDGDGAPVEVGPARTVRLTARCWKEVAGVWVSHERAPDTVHRVRPRRSP